MAKVFVKAKVLHPLGRFDSSGKSGGTFTFASGSPALVGCKRALYLAHLFLV